MKRKYVLKGHIAGSLMITCAIRKKRAPLVSENCSPNTQLVKTVTKSFIPLLVSYFLRNSLWNRTAYHSNFHLNGFINGFKVFKSVSQPGTSLPGAARHTQQGCRPGAQDSFSDG